MRGPLIEGIALAIVVFVVLIATAHLWGPRLAWAWKRAGHNLEVAATAFGRGVAKMLGQGRTRPHDKGNDREQT